MSGTTGLPLDTTTSTPEPRRTRAPELGTLRATVPCLTVLLGTDVNCGTRPALRTSVSADWRLTPTTSGEEVQRPLPSHQPPTAAAPPSRSTTVATISQRRRVTLLPDGRGLALCGSADVACGPGTTLVPVGPAGRT